MEHMFLIVTIFIEITMRHYLLAALQKKYHFKRISVKCREKSIVKHPTNNKNK